MEGKPFRRWRRGCYREKTYLQYSFFKSTRCNHSNLGISIIFVIQNHNKVKLSNTYLFKKSFLLLEI